MTLTQFTMKQTYKLIDADRLSDMLIRLDRAIEICENAKPINWDTYDETVDPLTTHPGALGHAQGALSWLKQDLELFTSDASII